VARALLLRRCMRTRLLLQHLANVAAPLAALAISTSMPARVLASIFLFFALFNWMHDVMHGTLGLSRRANRWLLSALAATIGVSAEATRFFHFRHHARPFASDDLEGRDVDVPWPRAIVRAPFSYLGLPWFAWRLAPKHGRRAQWIEWLLVAIAIAVAARHDASRVYAAVVLAAQLTIPLWGAKLPHRPPRWLLAVARALLFTNSPMVIGLVLHEEHHARPRLSSFALAEVRRQTSKAREGHGRDGVTGPQFGEDSQNLWAFDCGPSVLRSG
jgi:fatty acid desaturase